MSQTINSNQLLKYTVMFLISQLNSTINVRQQIKCTNLIWDLDVASILNSPL